MQHIPLANEPNSLPTDPLNSETAYTHDNHSETTLSSQRHSQTLPKESTMNEPIPRITYDLRKHKKGIAISWGILCLSSLIIPILLYYILKYAANLDEAIVLAVPTALFGAPTLFSLTRRTWSLTKKNSTTRPLGSSAGWKMDYFNWNFFFGFVVVTVIIAVGDSVPSPRAAALGLPFILTQTSIQLVIAAVMQTFNVAQPFRISSVARGETIRGGVYALTEDIIAVDSHGGRQFRQELSRRWEASREIRRLCYMLDWAWGVCGTVIGIATIAIMFTVDSVDAGYTIGWAVPWGFAIVGGLGTLQICKSVVRRERRNAAAVEGRV